MSIIHVNQIASKIDKMFGQYIDVTDMNVRDSEFKIKKLTRCLSAYAIYRVGGADEKEAAEAVVDGGDDNGIDAIYYSTNNKRMTIVQSKWSQKGV